MSAPDRRRVMLGAVALFVLLALVYTASVGLRATRGAAITADEPFYLLTTQSLLADGDLDLRQQYEASSYREFFDHPDGLWRQSIPLEDGRLLSPHEPGLSVLLMPAFVVGGLVGTQVQMLLISAATFAATFVLVAFETRRVLLAWLVTGAVGLTATAFVYSTEIYPEFPAALCVVLTLLVLRMPRPGVRGAVAVALLLTAMMWLGMKYAPLGAVLGLCFLLRADRRGRVAFLALSFASALVYAWWHLHVFGALTAYNSNTVYEGAPTLAVLQSHLGFEDRVYRLWGLFVDRTFGIGRWAPVLLPLLPSLVLLVRRGTVGRVATAAIVTQLLVATFITITMMGFWFAGRMLVVVLPLFALALTVLAMRLPAVGRVAFGALALYSVTVTALLAAAVRRGQVTLAVDPWEMPAWAFQAATPLFPDYRMWTLETNLLTAAWLLAAAVAGWAAWRAGRPARAVAANDAGPRSGSDDIRASGEVRT